MKSEYSEKFNHDQWSTRYDEQVLDERDPIRTGYNELLSWVIKHAKIGPESTVLDLGSGTGNTSSLIKFSNELVCVDVSRKMSEIAGPKLKHLPKVSFHFLDMLEYFHTSKERFDSVVSTYAIHHLTDPEKNQLFKKIFNCLNKKGRAVFGDLMFKNESQRDFLIEKYQSCKKYPDVSKSMKEEFYWQVDKTQSLLEDIGFVSIVIQQFSELSWGISAEKN